MSKKYLDELVKLMSQYKYANVKCKHFFSGAACWVNSSIFISNTPVGLALKVPESTRTKLLNEGGKPLQYFSKSPIKKEYVVLNKKMAGDKKYFKQLLDISIKYSEK